MNYYFIFSAFSFRSDIYIFFKNYFMCMVVLVACMSVYYICAWCPKRPEKDPLELELQKGVSHRVNTGD